MSEAATAVLALTRDLIARESITPGDAGCLKLIAARLEALLAGDADRGAMLELLDAGDRRARAGNAVLKELRDHVDQ